MFYQYNTVEEFKFNNLLKKYPHDAGWDIRAGHDMYLLAGASKKMGTGLQIIFPVGFYASLRSRSGLAINSGIEITNAGIIDAGYLGEIFLRVYNHSDRAFEIKKGDRIAQVLFGFSMTVSAKDLADTVIPIVFPELTYSEFFALNTDRGANGLGSTGTD